MHLIQRPRIADSPRPHQPRTQIELGIGLRVAGIGQNSVSFIEEFRAFEEQRICTLVTAILEANADLPTPSLDGENPSRVRYLGRTGQGRLREYGFEMCGDH